MRLLRLAAAVEAVSLAVLLVNLVTVHHEAVTSLGGPVHGTAYLAVIAATWLMPSAAAPGARWRALVPGVGGLLAVRRIRLTTRASDG
ncbi:DUF3817 domain-containing protein [Allonocardiopsis opalescens]|uniref:DUF3817 domain-containing protein n=1 Tax=Allonocardiopsis opalescens TaxID=1144618 RepID=A0A2T0PYW5_9ACTN|nr:DUF3817 domain-containing protein [Allonocardiopsis opalescens]PRX96708.1 hypothetical protein CLV72_107231 [Allonocardiopsis opalescens]